VPAPEVIAPARAGLKIEAIKIYRKMNPGIGLIKAQKVIDRL
jgi:ribosomal protein L7/L12